MTRFLAAAIRESLFFSVWGELFPTCRKMSRFYRPVDKLSTPLNTVLFTCIQASAYNVEEDPEFAALDLKIWRDSGKVYQKQERWKKF